VKQVASFNGNFSSRTSARVLAMQTLKVEILKPIAHSQVDPIQFDRHTELLKKNEADSLTSNEEHKLTSLRQTA
jgi:hypothetical protein